VLKPGPIVISTQHPKYKKKKPYKRKTGYRKPRAKSTKKSDKDNPFGGLPDI